MASTSGEDGDDQKKTAEKTAYDPTLDFFSDQFDPLKALRTPGVEPPVKDAKIYDNIYKFACMRLQPQNQQVVKKENSKIIPTVKMEKTIERRWLPHQMPIPADRTAHNRNVLTRMKLIEGPMAVLRKCKDERIKIKVWTRHSHDIRGYCIGFITLFDKHWNMVLEDVTEVWTRKKRRKIPAALDVNVTDMKVKSLVPPPITIIKSDKKTETCERHVDQFLIRGEQIAIISPLNTDCKS